MAAGQEIPQYEGPAAYKGPSMGYLMKTHQLAEKIIDTHELKPANILDEGELVLLRQYVADPSKKEDLLRKVNMLDDAGEKPGSKASTQHGSLVGYAIATDAFDDKEIGMLKDWFDSGKLDEELKGYGPRGEN